MFSIRGELLAGCGLGTRAPPCPPERNARLQSNIIMLPRPASLSCAFALLWRFAAVVDVQKNRGGVAAFNTSQQFRGGRPGPTPVQQQQHPGTSSGRSLPGHHLRRRRRKRQWDSSVQAAANDDDTRMKGGDDDCTGFGFGSQSSTSGGGYVPSGLTVAQYEQLKQREAQERATKDYGAWGPRFLRSTPPSGDWFAWPQLWTSGSLTTTSPVPTNANPSRRGAPLRNLAQALRRCIGAIAVFGKRWMPPFLLAYMALDTLLAAYSIFYVAQITLSQAAVHAATFVVRKQILVQLWRDVLLAKVVGAIFLTPLSQDCLQLQSRRLLWTPRRLWFVSVAGMIGALTVCSLTVLVMRWSLAAAAVSIGMKGIQMKGMMP